MKSCSPPPSHECDDPCLLRVRNPSRVFRCDCQGSKLRITPPPSLGPLVHPQVFARFMGVVALDTPQWNNPCQFYVGSPPATEMQNEQILHNEWKTDNEDSNPRPYLQAAPASSHHNRNLPLSLGRLKNVMKGYCPPTSMGLLPITLITHLFLVYKLMKLYDVT